MAGKIASAIAGLVGQNQISVPGGGVVDPHNQIVALQNRYAQLGIPNSTMLTQDIGGAENAASQATFQNQLQLAQLAAQQNLSNDQSQGTTAGSTAANQGQTQSTSGNLDQVPSSGVVG
jgi:hypothetical protein